MIANRVEQKQQTTGKTAHNKKCQHQATPPMAKTAQKAAKTFWEGQKWQTTPRGVGPRRKVGRGGEEEPSRGNSVGYRQILSLLEEGFQ